MKRVILQMVGLTILIVLVTLVAFGGGFQLNEHGARAMAQGGAYVARAYDPSAIYFNPAGLGFQTGIQVYAGATFIIPNITFYGPSNLSLNKKYTMVQQVFTPINVYGTYEIMDGLVAGLGVYNPYGLGSEWRKNWKGADKSIKVDLQSFFFSPTIAYKISDEFSFGIGVNYVTGSVMINKATAIPIGTDQQRPILTVDLSSTGFGFNFGALYKFTPEISVGASYRSSVKLDASGTAKFDPNYAVLELPQGDASSSITLPATGYIGAAYKPMENLEVKADYQFVSWSSYDSLKLEFKADPTFNSSTPKKYKDTYILRVGAEYTMDAFQFRAGYLYDHAPVDDIYIDPMLPDANRNGWNVGLGYKINEHIRVDGSYLFIKFKQRTVKNTVAGIDGTYNAFAHLFGIDIGYTF